MYEQYERERDANKGSLPVIQCNGVTPEVGKHGTNYKPNLSILKWVPRPADLGAPKGNISNAPIQTGPAQAAPASSVSEF